MNEKWHLMHSQCVRVIHFSILPFLGCFSFHMRVKKSQVFHVALALASAFFMLLADVLVDSWCAYLCCDNTIIAFHVISSEIASRLPSAANQNRFPGFLLPISRSVIQFGGKCAGSSELITVERFLLFFCFFGAANSIFCILDASKALRAK